MISHLLAFLGVATVVIVTPGQDTALTIRNTLFGGRRSGILTAGGVSTGQAIWALATSAGMAAVLQASAPAFEAVKLAGAARLELELREIAKRIGEGAVCTMGGVVTKPGIVTSVVETAECLLDQRHLDAVELAEMLSNAEAASRRFAEEENIEVEWERIWNIEPILFDERLIELADESIREVAGSTHRLPSGPLHDAAEIARAGIPTVMLFVQSLRGLSHTKLEDTKEEHLELAVRALDLLAEKTLPLLGGQA